MNQLKIKICGMKYPENMLQASALHPDYFGFIFYEKSSRFFDGIMPELPKQILKVGVFVDENLINIQQKITQYQLQLVQLHGNENPEFCAKLQSLPIKVIKTFAISNEFDFKILDEFETACDYFLFDTKGENPGGNGQSFDWDILKNYKSTKPLFLSGGIGLNSIKAIQNLKIPVFALDLNSKFETKPGLKNISQLQTFKQQLQ